MDVNVVIVAVIDILTYCQLDSDAKPPCPDLPARLQRAVGDLNDRLRKRLHEEIGAEVQAAGIRLAEMVAVFWSIGGAAYIDILIYWLICICIFIHMCK